MRHSRDFLVCFLIVFSAILFLLAIKLVCMPYLLKDHQQKSNACQKKDSP